jgi:hypothetical protein
MIQNNIYYQRQSGGLCRLHALNAFFGEDRITQRQFTDFQKQYDKINKTLFNVNTPCASFDIVSSNQKNIVSHILKQYGVYTRYYAINQLQKKYNADILLILNGEFVFVYDESHIYGARKKSNIWYTVNSIGGVRKTNINSLLKTKNLGFIIPVDIEAEFRTNISLINDVLCTNISESAIEAFLIQKHNDKQVLGDLEIPVSICVDILETKLHEYLKTHSSVILKKYERLHDIVYTYNHFISMFTDGRYNDIKLIIEYLPIIIFGLLCL